MTPRACFRHHGRGGSSIGVPSEARMVGARGRRGHRWSKAGVTVKGGIVMLASGQDPNDNNGGELNVECVVVVEPAFPPDW